MDTSKSAYVMHTRDQAAHALGIQLLEVSPDHAIVAMQVRDDMCNGLGTLHGGMTFLLADSAMGYACNSANEASLAASASIDWIAPARVGQQLIATARRSLVAGKSEFWEVAVEADDDSTIALFRGRTRSIGQPIVAERTGDAN